MESVIMCYGQPPKRATGNLLLDRMLGAEVVFMDTTKVRELPKDKMVAGYHKLRDDSTRKVVERYQAQGKKVYLVPIGGHCHSALYHPGGYHCHGLGR
jgi:1-aminocyclopropane-1-carboxylate deaminase/D-cysteine desulfhydrase-like pyridoxal-dependent ACC family enzyme